MVLVPNWLSVPTQEEVCLHTHTPSACTHTVPNTHTHPLPSPLHPTPLPPHTPAAARDCATGEFKTVTDPNERCTVRTVCPEATPVAPASTPVAAPATRSAAVSTGAARGFVLTLALLALAVLLL